MKLTSKITLLWVIAMLIAVALVLLKCSERKPLPRNQEPDRGFIDPGKMSKDTGLVSLSGVLMDRILVVRDTVVWVDTCVVEKFKETRYFGPLYWSEQETTFNENQYVFGDTLYIFGRVDTMDAIDLGAIEAKIFAEQREYIFRLLRQIDVYIEERDSSLFVELGERWKVGSAQ